MQNAQRRQLIAAAALGAVLPLQAQTAAPLRIVVGFPPGGSADVTARTLAERMQTLLGQTVLVENRAGAGGRIAMQSVKEAAPDGLTVVLVPFAVMVVQPAVFRSIRYDTTRDFTAVGNVASFPLALAVGPATPARNVPELIDWLRANPQQANFGTPAAGSLPHFMGEMLADKAKVKLTHVPFQGGAPLVTNLLGGQIAVGFDTPAEFAEHHRAGKLRILALSGGQRSGQFPDVPTLRESGIDIDASGWFAMFAPAGTSAPAIDRINAAMQAALRLPEVGERLTRLGLSPVPGSAAEMTRRLAADKALWEPIIKASGFQAD